MSELAQVLRPLLPVTDPAALVDASTGDDAAVYDLGDGRALVVTADFFSPMVDDAFDFGRIAAANALSDIYAMGAEPRTALAIATVPVGPEQKMEQLLEALMAGAVEQLNAAETALVGGHTKEGAELELGLSLSGVCRPER